MGENIIWESEVLGDWLLCFFFLQAPHSQIPWSTNDENYLGVLNGKMGNKQPAFTIHLDEPDNRRQKKHMSSKKMSSCEETIGLKAVVASMETRKPLTPIDNPMDLSSGEGNILFFKNIYCSDWFWLRLKPLLNISLVFVASFCLWYYKSLFRFNQFQLWQLYIFLSVKSYFSQDHLTEKPRTSWLLLLVWYNSCILYI